MSKSTPELPYLAPWRMLPAKPGVCQECAVDHPPDQPHNRDSLTYQYRFYGQNGRWPTWQDAIAHCPPETQGLWIQELKKAGAISE